MTPPSTTDAFINWAESYRAAPDKQFWLKLQQQRFNEETWHSLYLRLYHYLYQLIP